jgi:hypothetical protein
MGMEEPGLSRTLHNPYIIWIVLGMDLRDIRFHKPASCATQSSGSKVEESSHLKNVAASSAYVPNISPQENCYMGGADR